MVLYPINSNFVKPVSTYVVDAGIGFNWKSGYYQVAYFINGTPYIYGDYARNRVDETDGNVIDGGSGNDFIAAGTGADYVHGSGDNDYIWGMDNDDILFGDGGHDVIYGDGNKNENGFSAWVLDKARSKEGGSYSSNERPIAANDNEWRTVA